MATRAQVVAEARDWIGSPYLHQGRLKGQGVDCLGLLIGVGRSLGLVAPEFDVADYARQPEPRRLIAEVGQYLTPISMEQMQPGDVVVTRFEFDPVHFAILADYCHGGLSMIHAVIRGNKRGEVVEHRLDATNRARIFGAFVLPEIA